MKKIIYEENIEKDGYYPYDFMDYMERGFKEARLVSWKGVLSKNRFFVYKLPGNVELFYHFDYKQKRVKMKLRGTEKDIGEMEKKILSGIKEYLNRFHDFVS